MTSRDVPAEYELPRDLVGSIHTGDANARQAIRTLFFDVLLRLAERIGVQREGPWDSRRMADRLLHVVELRIRFRLSPETVELSWAAFRRAIVLHVAKVLVHPFGAKAASSVYAPALPQSEAYAAHAIFRPLEPVGGHYFGGDWVGAVATPDGGMWFLLADVMGHGYEAYLLAAALPDFWSICAQRCANDQAHPMELLLTLHDIVADCFPDGTFVEAVIGKLSSSGEVVVAPGGGVRVVTRECRTNLLQLNRVRGSLLGIMAPSRDDERFFQLDCGDEIAFASDGLFDQLEGYGDHAHSTQQQLTAATAQSLWSLLAELLKRSLGDYPQRDDITALTFVRRRPGASAEDPPV